MNLDIICRLSLWYTLFSYTGTTAALDDPALGFACTFNSYGIWSTLKGGIH